MIKSSSAHSIYTSRISECASSLRPYDKSKISKTSKHTPIKHRPDRFSPKRSRSWLWSRARQLYDTCKSKRKPGITRKHITQIAPSDPENSTPSPRDNKKQGQEGGWWGKSQGGLRVSRDQLRGGEARNARASERAAVIMNESGMKVRDGLYIIFRLPFFFYLSWGLWDCNNNGVEWKSACWRCDFSLWGASWLVSLFMRSYFEGHCGILSNSCTFFTLECNFEIILDL